MSIEIKFKNMSIKNNFLGDLSICYSILTKIIGFCVCGLVQSEPSQDKFLRRFSLSVRIDF
jgi:hypothetical protein